MDTPPFEARALVLAGNTLFAAGPPRMLDQCKVFSSLDTPETKAALADEVAALAGKKGACLWAVSVKDGKKLTEAKLESPPVFDGLIAAGNRLYCSTMDGRVICLGGKP
jgi:hypothetical protein